MLLTREEMTFDFGGARFDPEADRAVLGWLLNQFLYGEVAANQIGEWLYEAPDLESARFLARQAVEELQHVDSFIRIMTLLHTQPGPAHPIVRFLVTGLKATSWPEHVALIMAAGEGMRVADGRPGIRRRLLGLSIASLWAVRRLGASMERRFATSGSAVMRQLPGFARAVAATHELRLRRMGLLDRPLVEVPVWRQIVLVIEAHVGKLLGRAGRLLAAPLRALGVLRRRRLTDVYLADPALLRPATPDSEAL